MPAFLRSDFTAVGSYRAELGETPVWCQRTQSLLWVDILQQKLLRYWPAKAHTEIHPLPSLSSAALLTEKEDIFLLISQDGLHLYDYNNQTITRICSYPGREGTRPNEAAIAPDGSLWFGTMDWQENEFLGTWFRYETDDITPSIMMENVGIPNTLAWHECKVWFADSMQKRFFSANARRINPLKISCFSSGDKIPDGSALSLGGLLITACRGNSSLLLQQINQGELLTLENVQVPVTQPSCCTFGGLDMTELFITSARAGMTSPSDLDGALLQVQTATEGVPQNLFRLN